MFVIADSLLIKLQQLAVEIAFLNSNLDAEIYVNQKDVVEKSMFDYMRPNRKTTVFVMIAA